ncbi:MAG: hypothetical protein P4M11_09875, partial [Candidatus Pacebacteria bacterium]|nr:hypothetical protein [Candidatus Paceibacterota bacterium]
MEAASPLVAAAAASAAPSAAASSLTDPQPHKRPRTAAAADASSHLSTPTSAAHLQPLSSELQQRIRRASLSLRALLASRD